VKYKGPRYKKTAVNKEPLHFNSSYLPLDDFCTDNPDDGLENRPKHVACKAQVK
jgi:hypothetical protein